MQRRELITLLGGAAAAWPFAAGAQQDVRVRKVGVLWAFAENVPAWLSGIAAFRAELAKLGWVEGRNLRTEVRFGSGDPARNRVHAAEFVKLASDVVVTGGTDAARAMQERTRTTPIVIVGAADVAVNGLVKNIARPESNITGLPSRST